MRLRQSGDVRFEETTEVPALPDPVRHVTAHYLALAEEHVPGLVGGVYLLGSLGWGEWYDGRSDVDFLAVTRERPDADALLALAELHAELGQSFPRPWFDGAYVTWADLARSPAELPGVPGVLTGEWSDDGHGPSPVEWDQLAHHGLRVHGPHIGDIDVHADVGELRRYSHRNLAAYWAPSLARLEANRHEAARPDLLEWFVLGIPRLHHVVATGRQTSKDGAGHYALEVLGQQRWRPVVAEALTHRALGEASGMWAAREDELAGEVLAFCRLAMEAGLALDPDAPTDESTVTRQSGSHDLYHLPRVDLARRVPRRPRPDARDAPRCGCRAAPPLDVPAGGRDAP